MKTFLHGLLSTALVLSAVPVGAEMLPADPGPSDERARLLRVIQGPEIRARLIGHGVDPAEAEARVGALTDEEATLLASRLEELPAGAGGGDGFAVVVVAVAVFLVVKYLLPYILIGGGFLLLMKAANGSHR